MKITVATTLLFALSFPACAADPTKKIAESVVTGKYVESCAAFSPAIEDFVVLPDLRIGGLEDDETFTLPLGAPADVSFIQCERSGLLPAPSDYKVLAAGMPFVISSGNRIATLEISESRVNFRAIKGEFTDDEIPHIQAYLNRAQRLLDAAGSEA